jgi:hypothetical protein
LFFFLSHCWSATILHPGPERGMKGLYKLCYLLNFMWFPHCKTYKRLQWISYIKLYTTSFQN